MTARAKFDPLAVLDSVLVAGAPWTWRERAILVAGAVHADENGVCVTTIENLAGWTGLPARSVAKALDRFTAPGSACPVRFTVRHTAA